MSIRRYPGAFLVSLSLLAVSAATTAEAAGESDRWIRVDTAHFTFFSNGREDIVRTIAYDLEALRHVLTQLAPGTDLDAAVPTFFYVFGDEASFAPYRLVRRADRGSGPQHFGTPMALAAGFLVPHEHGNYAAVIGHPYSRPVRFVYKQYVHQLLHDHLPALPLWLRHGLAEYYSTFEIDGDTAKIGLPVQAHLEGLRLWGTVRTLALAEVLALDELPHDGGARGGFFTRAWALTHYLLRKDPALQKQLAAFVRRVSRGVDPGQAFAEAFDVDLAALEASLETYLLQREMTYARIPIDRGAHPAEITPLAGHEVLYRLGNLLAHSSPGHAEAAARHFRGALELAPEHGPSHAGLGTLAQAAGDDATALSHYRRAAQLSGADYLVQYLYGDSLARSLEGRRPQDEDAETRLAAAVVALEHSVALQPQFAQAWARLGYALNLAPEPSPRAAEALERALELLPGRLDVTYNLLLARARLGQREAADTAVVRLRWLGADDATLGRAREVQLRMDYREANRLVKDTRLDDAIAVFAGIAAETTDPSLRQQTEQRLSLLEPAAQYNRFGALYNEAVQLLREHRTQAAADVIARLEEITKPGRQRQMVDTLLEIVAERSRPGS